MHMVAGSYSLVYMMAGSCFPCVYVDRKLFPLHTCWKGAVSLVYMSFSHFPCTCQRAVSLMFMSENYFPCVHVRETALHTYFHSCLACVCYYQRAVFPYVYTYQRAVFPYVHIYIIELFFLRYMSAISHIHIISGVFPIYMF